MAIEMEVEIVSKTDLRDSAGNQMVIAKVTSFAGTYESGGIVITPEMFGFNRIEYMNAQSSISVTGEDFGGDPGDPWVMVTTTSLMRMVEDGELVWRWVWHVTSDFDGAGPMAVLDEMPTGQAIAMTENYAPLVMVIGS